MPRHLPYTVKPEVVRGCSQRCPFCSIPSMPWVKEPYKFMDPYLFRRLCDSLAKWRPKVRIEIAGRGEPSFHHDLIDMLAYARVALPQAQLMLTSNGDLIRKGQDWFLDHMRAWFNVGLNMLMLDCYTQERYEHMTTLARHVYGEVLVSDFFDDNRHPYTYRGPRHAEVIIVDATPGRDNRIRWYQNQAGNVNTAAAVEAGFNMHTEPQLDSMCVRPFRELIVNYDGTVPLCCNDWSDQAVIGTFPDQPLEAIWDGMDAYRRQLLQKDRRPLTPCSVCSERAGMRSGLEHDWFK